MARFAFDTIAIPLISDDNERSFSAARNLITYRRNRLMGDLIEATQCLRQSYGHPNTTSTTSPGTTAESAPNDAVFDDEDAILSDYNDAAADSFVVA